MKPKIPKSSRAIAPAVGITASLKAQSRKRRELHQSLAALGSHAPKRRNDLGPALTIVSVPIDQLQPAARRVRKADPVQLAKIRASIEKFGICQPILIDAQNRIVHGHLVLEAARALGMTHVSAIVIGHLDANELRLLTIALNRLGETGQWDKDALQLEIAELIDLGEDVILTGFDAPEIDMLLLDDDADDGAPEEEIPALGTTAVSKTGDLWVLGAHRLLQGDSREAKNYERLMGPDEQARIVLTDEPYNVPNVGHVTSQGHHREFAMAAGEMSCDEFAAFNKDWMSLSAAWVMDGGLVATFIDWRSIGIVLATALDLGLSQLNFVVWAKSNGGQGSMWRSQHELLPVFKKGTAPHLNNVELGRFGRWRSNVWNYPGASSLGSDARDGLIDHPTVKPRALLEDALLDVTARGEIVLEPFAGSGSTLLAAEATGRVCRAIEIDGLYCDLAIRRWESLTGEQAVLEETGETFAEVAQRRENEGAV